MAQNIYRRQVRAQTQAPKAAPLGGATSGMYRQAAQSAQDLQRIQLALDKTTQEVKYNNAAIELNQLLTERRDEVLNKPSDDMENAYAEASASALDDVLSRSDLRGVEEERLRQFYATRLTSYGSDVRTARFGFVKQQLIAGFGEFYQSSVDVSVTGSTSERAQNRLILDQRLSSLVEDGVITPDKHAEQLEAFDHDVDMGKAKLLIEREPAEALELLSVETGEQNYPGLSEEERIRLRNLAEGRLAENQRINSSRNTKLANDVLADALAGTPNTELSNRVYENIIAADGDDYRANQFKEQYNANLLAGSILRHMPFSANPAEMGRKALVQMGILTEEGLSVENLNMRFGQGYADNIRQKIATAIQQTLEARHRDPANVALGLATQGMTEKEISAYNDPRNVAARQSDLWELQGQMGIANRKFLTNAQAQLYVDRVQGIYSGENPTETLGQIVAELAALGADSPEKLNQMLSDLEGASGGNEVGFAALLVSINNPTAQGSNLLTNALASGRTRELIPEDRADIRDIWEDKSREGYLATLTGHEREQLKPLMEAMLAYGGANNDTFEAALHIIQQGGTFSESTNALIPSSVAGGGTPEFRRIEGALSATMNRLTTEFHGIGENATWKTTPDGLGVVMVQRLNPQNEVLVGEGERVYISYETMQDMYEQVKADVADTPSYLKEGDMMYYYPTGTASDILDSRGGEQTQFHWYEFMMANYDFIIRRDGTIGLTSGGQGLITLEGETKVVAALDEDMQ